MCAPSRPRRVCGDASVSRRRLLLSLGAGIVAMSTASILIRMAQAEGVPSSPSPAWRLVSCVVGAPALRHLDPARGDAQSHAQGVGAPGAGRRLSWAALCDLDRLARDDVGRQLSGAGFHGPVFVALGSWFLLRERLASTAVLGIAVAAAGSVIVGWADLGHGEDRLVGDLLALTGGVMGWPATS